VQEYTPFNERAQEIFQGCPVIKNGYWYASESPGYGIEVDEKLAARFPYGTDERPEQKQYNGGWGEIRRRDGTVIKQ
jgi:mannonate dehydratase